MTDIADQPPPAHRPDLIPTWGFVVQDFKIRYEDALDGIVEEHKKTAWNVLNDMDARDKIGRARYGTPLTTNNGRDQLVDAYQELLDGVVYLRAAWLEGAQVSEVYYAQLDALMKVRLMIDARSVPE